MHKCGTSNALVMPQQIQHSRAKISMVLLLRRYLKAKKFVELKLILILFPGVRLS